MKYELAPSILSADFSRLAHDVAKVEPFSGRIHVDVMDGHFVPNLSMGPVVVESLRPVTSLPLEVHLMVEEPELFIDPFAKAGADRLIFHLEVASDPASIAAKIREAGPTAGLAINPETEWTKAKQWLDEVDLLLVMTVHPGYGGQTFIEEMLPKITQARQWAIEKGLAVDIEVDGGIDYSSAGRARQAGANVFVAGHSVFRADDPGVAARDLARLISVQE